VVTRSSSADQGSVRPTPRTSRRRGEEVLDVPGAHPELARRSLRDIAIANALFGGTRAVLTELSSVWAGLPRRATLLDVGTGIGDIPARARAAASRQGVTLETIGLEATGALAHGSQALNPLAVCGDARSLPFADRSMDVVICSQVLHHFFDGDVHLLLTELDRVARYRVIVSDLRRSRIAALGIWLASFGLAFHPVSRHDGVLSIMRGFRAQELRELVAATIGVEPLVRHHLGYRLTASWAPDSSTVSSA
jgi:SAM-dependent methyltransferase